MVTVAVSWLHEPLQVTENILWLPVSATGIVVFHADLEMNATIIEMIVQILRFCFMQTHVKFEHIWLPAAGQS